MTELKKYLIVDAYNIINQWKFLKDIASHSLENARDELITILLSYSKIKNYNLVVVFDAYNNEEGVKKEENDNITIIYTKKNQTADSYIEKLVYELPTIYEIRVATSDYTLQRMILTSGGIRISALELEKEVEYVLKTSLKQASDKYNQEKNDIYKNIDKETIIKLEKFRTESVE
ncbi:MAG: NYN domain-containing protein [Eubacteriaceae bacterium]